ncbi:MAG: Flp pilus assembly complex ATPase component TadA [Nitrososphaerota archaeon]|nr:Flp pilus assembly complex ATPase component TadA [Nitrososphaerota archaeon]
MTETIVLDTSVVISGAIIGELESGSLGDVKVCIPHATLDELQAQASKNVDVGFVGLEHLKNIREVCERKGLQFYFVGPTPSLDDIRLARSGRIDAIIRNVAREEKGVLYTGDYVLHLVADAEGVKVRYFRPSVKLTGLEFEKYFDGETLSVHLKEGVVPMAKKGSPGNLRLVKLGDAPLTRQDLERMEKEVREATRISRDAYEEIRMGGMSVTQFGSFRLAVARPPFSDGMEMTVVRPTVKLTLDDYHLSDKLMARLKDSAEGVLIAGPPGSGKTTLASSIAEYYMKLDKIVKTMEAPRDLQVGPEITQYGKLEDDFANTAEMLLLVRPDYTVFDEVRTSKDFAVFADMRLAGVGMVGVVHASGPVDAIQRFMGRLELGMVPHVLDTVIYVKDGGIREVLELGLVVRVPTGMTEDDLARPLVEVKDFETGKLKYEIYTYGEENVVVPIKGERRESGLSRLAGERIAQVLRSYDPRAEVEMASEHTAVVQVSRDAIPRLIGKGGENVDHLEELLGVHLEVKPRDEGAARKRKNR